MKHLMILPALLLASPALAHPGLHLAPHGAEWMPVFMGLAVIGTAAAIALRARLKAKAAAGK
ncbi:MULTISPECIES: hypothetical protein [unclassified Sulfitobacter]|jgi:hypothetical protein|uniref:hypothetical protein n=1 Tax=unclassified Sulfitobacter TaxID=196795 RepID=UPI001593FA83|nr:hypothetical protein [Sulfitobacter sp. HGT1]MBQ0805270.1 hypothetical protein [Sulfitobacter sp.]